VLALVLVVDSYGEKFELTLLSTTKHSKPPPGGFFVCGAPDECEDIIGTEVKAKSEARLHFRHRQRTHPPELLSRLLISGSLAVFGGGVNLQLQQWGIGSR
jgi:hypothetical protein